MTKVFISYSRKDKVFAEKLNTALESMELESWTDWDDIPPTADWWEQIQKGIESVDAFLFLLSCDSVSSRVCGQEIDHAVKNGKRIIPLVVRDVNPSDVHPALARLNWIFFREQDDFDRSLKKLEAGIETDLAWVEAHRRLQVRALEWDKRMDRSLLLRGKDLHEAEEQSAIAGQKDPQPTDLQRRYILASRRGESRTRNGVLVIGAVVIGVLALLSLFAIRQRNTATENALTAVANEHTAQTAQANAIAERNDRATAQANAVAEKNIRATAQANAEEQANISRSRAIAALSTTYRDTDPELSMLFAVKAFQTANTYEARNSLLTALQLYPPQSICKGDSSACLLSSQKEFIGDAISMAFSPDGELIAIGGCRGGGMYCPLGQVIVWEKQTWKEIGRLEIPDEFVWMIEFSPDNQTLAVGIDDGAILWNIPKNESRQLGRRSAEKNLVVALAFSKDGGRLVAGGSVLTIWDTRTNEQLMQYSKKDLGFTYGITFDPQEELIACAGCATSDASCPEGKIMILSATSYQPTGDPVSDQPSEIMSVAFDSSGQRLISADANGQIIVWDARTRKPFGLTLQESRQPESLHVSVVKFSPDGQMLASASSGKKFRLWEIASRQPIGKEIQAAEWTVKGLSFSADGKTLASVDHFGIKLWDLDPNHWVNLVCESVHRNFSQAEWVTFFPDEGYQKTCPQWPLEIELTPLPDF